jgi:cytoskeletal protein CcmA (bactofilin family)
MLKESTLTYSGIASPANGANPENPFVDTRIQFEAWMDEVRPVAPLQIDHGPPDFVVECDSGSNCEIQFDGVVHLKGFFGGNIRSAGGTLVTGPGIIDANIEVGTAIIGSFGKLNIAATDGVLLRGKVSVTGCIRSHSLSIREGAIFDGDCLFLETLTLDAGTPHLQTADAAPVVMGASARGD